jgi:hypothetical protein
MKGPQNETGGWGGIRTLETLARLPVFKTGAFNHSATHPCKKLKWLVAARLATNRELPPDCRPGCRIKVQVHLKPYVARHFSIPSIAFAAAASAPSNKWP